MKVKKKRVQMMRRKKHRKRYALTQMQHIKPRDCTVMPPLTTGQETYQCRIRNTNTK